MADPYVGEIRMTGFNFAPEGWFLCQGQSLPIADYEALFMILGTTYGGDGQFTFSLPNLCGRMPVHSNGSSVKLGQMGGEENHTLIASELPSHSHALESANIAGTSASVSNNLPAKSASNPYSTASPSVAMSAAAVQPAGGNQSHNNMPPVLAVNFIICWTGIYPSQN